MIEVRNLRKAYRRTVALEGVTFSIRKGDVFGFIGPNGAGKTTTIRILATLLEPTSGTATVGGHDVIERPEEVRRLIGYMPDLFGVYDGITVWEYLDFFAAAYGIGGKERRKRVDDVMELTDLGPLSWKMVSDLSKGMKQRLCLAKTLVHDPEVLILDEPASGLDPRARIEIRALLKELARMGKTILISSHILTELSDICNTVGVIEKGRLLAHGEVDAILDRLEPGCRVRIRVGAGAADRAAAALRPVADVLDVEMEGDLVRVRFGTGREEVGRLVEALVGAGVAVLSFDAERRDLEGLFMQITQGELA